MERLVHVLVNLVLVVPFSRCDIDIEKPDKMEIEDGSDQEDRMAESRDTLNVEPEVLCRTTSRLSTTSRTSNANLQIVTSALISKNKFSSVLLERDKSSQDEPDMVQLYFELMMEVKTIEVQNPDSTLTLAFIEGKIPPSFKEKPGYKNKLKLVYDSLVSRKLIKAPSPPVMGDSPEVIITSAPPTAKTPDDDAVSVAIDAFGDGKKSYKSFPSYEMTILKDQEYDVLEPLLIRIQKMWEENPDEKLELDEVKTKILKDEDIDIVIGPARRAGHKKAGKVTTEDIKYSYQYLCHLGIINKRLYSPRETRSEFFWLFMVHLTINLIALSIDIANGGIDLTDGSDQTRYHAVDIRLGCFVVGIGFLFIYYRRHHVTKHLIRFPSFFACDFAFCRAFGEMGNCCTSEGFRKILGMLFCCRVTPDMPETNIEEMRQKTVQEDDKTSQEGFNQNDVLDCLYQLEHGNNGGKKGLRSSQSKKSKLAKYPEEAIELLPLGDMREDPQMANGVG